MGFGVGMEGYGGWTAMIAGRRLMVTFEHQVGKVVGERVW